MSKFITMAEAIKAYLSKLAETDELFAKTFSKKNKSIDGCCNYIMDEARKAAKDGQCVALSDEDTYNLAVHYYDEDSIVAPNKVDGVSVAVSIEQENKATKTKTKAKSKTKHAKVVELQPSVEVTETVNDADEDYTLDIPAF